MPDQRYNTGDGLTRVEEPRGVWVAYFQDWNPIPKAVFLDELPARRYAARTYCDVRFLAFGEEWDGTPHQGT